METITRVVITRRWFNQQYLQLALTARSIKLSCNNMSPMNNQWRFDAGATKSHILTPNYRTDVSIIPFQLLRYIDQLIITCTGGRVVVDSIGNEILSVGTISPAVD